MKRKLFPLLTLTLAGALLFMGCNNQTNLPTNSERTSIASSMQSSSPKGNITKAPELEFPTPTYRPDLMWSTGLPPYQYNNGDLSYHPPADYINVEFLGQYPLGTSEEGFENTELETTEFAVYFLYYDIDIEYRNAHNDRMRPCNWDALVDYLADLGIEEIGREGGFSIPIFAATMVELDVLDCKTVQDVMGVTDYSPYGLSLCISSITEERNIGNPDTSGMYCYAYMAPWVEADE